MSLSDFFKKVGKTILSQTLKVGFKNIFPHKQDKSERKQTEKPQSSKDTASQKSHPWRFCPNGQHWVRTHPLSVPASSEGPERMTTRHGHCRINSGRAEYYTADELREIAIKYFNKLTKDQGQEIGQNYGRLEKLSQKTQGSARAKKIITGLILILTWMFDASLASSANIKMHKRTEHFVDIEAPVNQLKIECSNGNPKSGNYYMSFDIFDGTEVYSFFYRRPLNQVMCKEEEKEYRQMLKDAQTVRIVGISPNEKKEPSPDPFKNKDLKKAPVPVLVKWTNSVFIRLQVGEKCKAYFADDCNLPKNYWAKTIPPK